QEVACGSADVMRNPRRFLAEAVILESHGDYGVVVRPDGSSLIVVRIERRVCRGERADTPPGPPVRRHQAFPDLLGPVRRHDAGPKAMTDIRSNGEDFVLLAIQRVGVEAQLVVPKSRVEPLKQGSGLSAQLSRTVALAECIKHLSHTEP